MKKLIEDLVCRHKTNNPFKLCEALNIKYLFITLTPEVLGIFQNADGTKIIYINKDLDKKEKYFICCHELGHAILHSHEEIFLCKLKYEISDEKELEADAFANYLYNYRNSHK